MSKTGQNSDMDQNKIRTEIRTKYARAADSPEELFKYPTGRSGARGLGYPVDLIESAPRRVVEGFSGIGNPLAILPVELGSKVLDVGCGTGFDLFCSSRKIGGRGLAAGIDITPEMVAQAVRTLEIPGTKNIKVVCNAVENISFLNETFDIVIANGTLNLSPDKPNAFSEIFRVLRPGGRLQFADLVLKRPLPESEKTPRSWSE